MRFGSGTFSFFFSAENNKNSFELWGSPVRFGAITEVYFNILHQSQSVYVYIPFSSSLKKKQHARQPC